MRITRVAGTPGGLSSFVIPGFSYVTNTRKPARAPIFYVGVGLGVRHDVVVGKARLRRTGIIRFCRSFVVGRTSLVHFFFGAL